MDRGSDRFDPAAYKAAFGAAVAARRVAAGLNRELFARIARLGGSHLYLIERGETAPSIVTVHKIADAFGCTASDLVADAEKRMQDDTPSERTQ